MTRTAPSLVGSLLAVVLLTACDALEAQGPEQSTPMPANVPAGPQYSSVDDVVSALERKGIDCHVLRRRSAGLDCEARIDGTGVENQIQVLDPKEHTRDEIGNSIAAWRTSGNTIVAAGNWFIRVVPNGVPRYSEKIAEALDAVVLPPPYHLPHIPDEPSFASVDELADALDEAVGCTRRKTEGAGALLCATRTAASASCGASGQGRDAGLILHDSPAARDDYIRLRLSDDHAPYRFLTAGNWTIKFCDAGTRKEAAAVLGAAVIDHSPGDR